MNRKPLSLALLGIFVAAVIAGCTAPPPAEDMATASLPVNRAFAGGKEIYFVHLEASDEATAQMMTHHLQSPVFYVPALAKTPPEALANVYSFKNGAAGQVSVFDDPPGTQGYSPLRELNIVVWAEGAPARELKSASEILTAQEAGELAVKPTGIVINMPVVSWDGGKR